MAINDYNLDYKKILAELQKRYEDLSRKGDAQTAYQIMNNIASVDEDKITDQDKENLLRAYAFYIGFGEDNGDPQKAPIEEAYAALRTQSTRR